jgi:uncharacterized membrane protein
VTKHDKLSSYFSKEKSMDEKYIRISDIAKQMKKDKSAIFRMIKKKGYHINKVYDDKPETRGQSVSIILRKDYESFLKERQNIR